MDSDGEVYRFVINRPIDPNEFRSCHETGEANQAPPCRRCGLSVFRSIRDIRLFLRYLRQNFPSRRSRSHIAKRILTSGDGKLKLTGNRGHHTWWAYENASRQEGFEYIEAP
jgi:hypothetical protein